MKKILLASLLMLALNACIKKDSDIPKTNTGIPGYSTITPRQKVLNRLMDTSWEIPSYPIAKFEFKKEGTTVVMSESFKMENARLTLVEENKDLVVFIVDDLTNSVTFSLKMKDKDTLYIAAHAAGGGDDINKAHELMRQEFKRIKE